MWEKYKYNHDELMVKERNIRNAHDKKWLTGDGEVLLIKLMNTYHILNCLRMIENRTDDLFDCFIPVFNEELNSRGGFINYRNSDSKYNIKRVIFNEPATIVLWIDGTKTIVRCQEGDTYDKEKGLLMCIAKKVYGNKGSFNDILKNYIEEE